MHLSAGELVDLAEGTRAPGSAPHLASCDACRRALEGLRVTMAGIEAAVEVPEPPPLFWDRLSARVGEAVAAEGEGEVATEAATAESEAVTEDAVPETAAEAAAGEVSAADEQAAAPEAAEAEAASSEHEGHGPEDGSAPEKTD